MASGGVQETSVKFRGVVNLTTTVTINYTNMPKISIQVIWDVMWVKTTLGRLITLPPHQGQNFPYLGGLFTPKLFRLPPTTTTPYPFYCIIMFKIRKKHHPPPTLTLKLPTYFTPFNYRLGSDRTPLHLFGCQTFIFQAICFK